MCHFYRDLLVLEYGRAHTSSLELQDFNDTYAAFVAYDKWFLEKKLEGPTSTNSGFLGWDM